MVEIVKHEEAVASDVAATVQAATLLLPGCILLSSIACIQIGLITTTFYGKIGTFEGACIYPWPCFVTTAHPCSAAIFRYIMQLCMLATFNFNARLVCRVSPRLRWGVSNHDLSWSFMFFYGRFL